MWTKWSSLQWGADDAVPDALLHQVLKLMAHGATRVQVNTVQHLEIIWNKPLHVRVQAEATDFNPVSHEDQIGLEHIEFH